MNLASSSLASSSPMACLLGSEKRRRAFLMGLNPFRMFRLCSASLRGIPGMSEGCQAKMSQFSRKNALSAASTSGLSCAPMEAVFVVSVGWTWNLTISSAGLKEVDLDLLSSISRPCPSWSATQLVPRPPGLRIMPRGPVRLSCFRHGALCPDH